MVETDWGRPEVGVEPWVGDSLFALGGIYTPLGNGEYVYYGERPGAGWHGHGYCEKTLTMLVEGEPVEVRLFKHRWRLVGTNETVHGRPPDDPALVRCCTLIVFLVVGGWVSSPVGLYRREEVVAGLEGSVSERTVQRWASRAISEGLSIQQAIRLVIIEEAEPRPVESLFEGGLSPPDAVIKRRWRCPADVEALWRAYAMLLVACEKLARHASSLLAGARRRWPTTKAPFGI